MSSSLTSSSKGSKLSNENSLAITGNRKLIPPLAFKVSNRNAYYLSIYDLEIIMARCHATPGLDATASLKIKSFGKPENLKCQSDDTFVYFLIIDMTLKALIPTMLISHFSIDTSNTEGTKQFISAIKRKIITLNKNISKPVFNHCKNFLNADSKHFKEYLKYYRDARSDVIKYWLKLIDLRPSKLLRKSLEGITLNRSEARCIFPRPVYFDSPECNSVFGITGL